MESKSVGNERTQNRLVSIDALRGLVIILMMLDHVRERFYMHVRTGDPIYDTIDADLFFTRILTHFCAPIFIFLAGLSTWLYAHSAKGGYRLPSAFLFKRGLVIIMIELIFYYILWLDSYPNFLFLQVLWAIGLCMIALSLACRLNYWVIGALGFIIVFGHNALGPIDFEPNEFGYILWTILHDSGELGKIGGLTISLSYPALPWFGVILLGYFAGPLFAPTFNDQKRRKILVTIGLICLSILLILRGFNIYGETLPWTMKDTVIGTIMSFLNYTKYPPSLDYILFTLGIGLIFLRWLESVSHENKLLNVLKEIGSVPMFIYILHLYILLAAYWVLYAIFGATHGARFGLDNVLWIWIGMAMLVLIVHPIARKFAYYKHSQKHNKKWLSYF